MMVPDHRNLGSFLWLVPLKSDGLVLMDIRFIGRGIFQIMRNTQGEGKGKDVLKRSEVRPGAVRVRGKMHRLGTPRKLGCVRERALSSTKHSIGPTLSHSPQPVAESKSSNRPTCAEIPSIIGLGKTQSSFLLMDSQGSD